MKDICFRLFEEADADAVSQMIKALYQEGMDSPAESKMTDEKIEKTFNRLRVHPDNGSIIVFEKHALLGYAILLNFWSNEYGGMILYVDELYVQPAYRSQGLGSQFIEYIKEQKPHDSLALRLEVLPYNARARKLYQQLGFEKMNRDFMMLYLD